MDPHAATAALPDTKNGSKSSENRLRSPESLKLYKSAGEKPQKVPDQTVWQSSSSDSENDELPADPLEIVTSLGRVVRKTSQKMKSALAMKEATMTNSSLANEIISSYGEGSSSSEIDEQDIPLAAKANLNRLSSHETISPGGASLNRKQGLVGSPKTHNPAGKLAHPVGVPPLLPSGPTHSKGAPSVGYCCC
ncbi:hypothetical protein PTTG_28773 [Puccinia triticina 1-1 BBBD Race 1]|uniref:Uncharacterized protein n=1 Tax=Puccinia triticina (isolate 1-1 / race 1 (BBBD)) TaxID=630390 RepID=A0A180GA81_PUCT1|nr:hypothetical protein PTTG_28773 [Puccinia triticina 1-1 BBBD Race 1]